jgi:2,4'-dihydroxyacetophenone dioxygenase
MLVEGANMNLNDDDSLMFIMDAGWIENTIYQVAEATGQKVPPFIRPGDIAQA